MAKRLEVKTGDRYGRLTILKEVNPYVSPSGNKTRKFLCQCDCNSEPFEVFLNSLRNGDTKSCGCVRKEKAKETHKRYNTYDLTSGEYGIGYTSKGEEFLFDLEDFEKIKDYCWLIDKDGYVVAKDTNTKKMIKFHRLITNCQDGKVVDHIDHKKNNNCKSNLRICMHSENMKNLSIRSNNKSGITGVSWHKASNKWQAYIGIDGKTINLGYFTSKEDAIKTRKEAEQLYFGEYRYKDNKELKLNQTYMLDMRTEN